MNRAKRILAFIAAIGLAGLYLITLIVALTGNEATSGLLMACIVATVLVSVLFYAFFLVAKVLGNHPAGDDKKPPEQEKPSQKEH